MEKVIGDYVKMLEEKLTHFESALQHWQNTEDWADRVQEEYDVANQALIDDGSAFFGARPMMGIRPNRYNKPCDKKLRARIEVVKKTAVEFPYRIVVVSSHDIKKDWFKQVY